MPRRRFTRSTDSKSYRKLYVIATEGHKTEPQYFSMFNGKNTVTQIRCLKDKNASDPKSVLRRMNRYLKEEGLKKSDEAWLVVDRDSWTKKHLAELLNWSKAKENYGLALSNPKFEYWLLLHFDEGRKVKTSKSCSEALKKYLPNYDKGFDVRKVTTEMIKKAVIRAQNIESSETELLNKKGSTAYKLVESILENEKTIR